jgi:Rrf2 family protein
VRLSAATYHATVALTYLVARGDRHCEFSYKIARVTGAPESTLPKVFRRLVQAGRLRYEQGPYGGYRLAVPAGRISLLDVVEAVDGPLHGEAPAVGSCEALNRRLQAICDRVADEVRRLLAGVSVAELAGGKPKTRVRGRS